MFVVARGAGSVVQKILIFWDFPQKTVSRVYTGYCGKTEKEKKKKKHAISCRFADVKRFLMTGHEKIIGQKKTV